MSLRVTQCPGCESTFNTSAAQLQASAGTVRCGVCLTLFQAPDHFIDAEKFADSGTAQITVEAAEAENAQQATLGFLGRLFKRKAKTEPYKNPIVQTLVPESGHSAQQQQLSPGDTPLEPIAPATAVLELKNSDFQPISQVLGSADPDTKPEDTGKITVSIDDTDIELTVSVAGEANLEAVSENLIKTLENHQLIAAPVATTTELDDTWSEDTLNDTSDTLLEPPNVAQNSIPQHSELADFSQFKKIDPVFVGKTRTNTEPDEDIDLFGGVRPKILIQSKVALEIANRLSAVPPAVASSTNHLAAANSDNADLAFAPRPQTHLDPQKQRDIFIKPKDPAQDVGLVFIKQGEFAPSRSRRARRPNNKNKSASATIEVSSNRPTTASDSDLFDGAIVTALMPEKTVPAVSHSEAASPVPITIEPATAATISTSNKAQAAPALSNSEPDLESHSANATETTSTIENDLENPVMAAADNTAENLDAATTGDIPDLPIGGSESDAVAAISKATAESFSDRSPTTSIQDLSLAATPQLIAEPQQQPQALHDPESSPGTESANSKPQEPTAATAQPGSLSADTDQQEPNPSALNQDLTSDIEAKPDLEPELEPDLESEPEPEFEPEPELEPEPEPEQAICPSQAEPAFSANAEEPDTDSIREIALATEFDMESDLEALPQASLVAVESVAGALVLDAQSQPRKLFKVKTLAMVMPLFLLLGTAILWQQMPRLSLHPDLRPWYLQACQLLPCQVPIYADTDAIRSQNLSVRSHPEVSGLLAVTTVFRNEGNFPQPFPVLRLQFTDQRRQTVAQQEFLPSEYLDPSLRDIEMMPVLAPVQAQVEIEDPGPAAVNYSLVFIPN